MALHTDKAKAVNSLTEEMIDARNPALATPAETATSVPDLLGQLKQMLKNITGESTWYGTVADSISGLLDSSGGHGHTGNADDAPQIAASGLEDDAVETAKIKDEAATPAKIASGIILQSAIATRAATNITTTSTTYVDVTGLTITLTNVEAGSDILIEATIGTAAPRDKGDNALFAIDVDGNTRQETFARSTEATGTNLGDWKPHHLSYLEKGVSAGSHIIKIQWKGTGVSTVLVNLGGSVAASNLIAMEIKN